MIYRVGRRSWWTGGDYIVLGIEVAVGRQHVQPHNVVRIDDNGLDIGWGVDRAAYEALVVPSALSVEVHDVMADDIMNFDTEWRRQRGVAERKRGCES